MPPKRPRPRGWKRRGHWRVERPPWPPTGTLNAFSSVLARGQSGPRSRCPISLDQYTGDVAPGGVWYYDLAPFNSACGAEGPR